MWGAGIASWWLYWPSTHVAWVGFRTYVLEWVKLVVGTFLSSERFFSGFSDFPLSLKINISKFQFDHMQKIPENHFWVGGASWVNIINYYYNYL